MCNPQQPTPLPAAPIPPSRTSAEVQNRVAAATRLPINAMESVLTSPLGDPNYAKSINRTVLTGALT